MKLKSFFLGAVLALFTLSLASAKSYEITLGAASKVGSTQLAAGSYRLKVEGTTATFTNVETAKQVTATVKVDAVDKKYETTAVDSTKSGDMEQINAIELGGSKTKLEFGAL